MRQYTFERVDGPATYQWWCTLRFNSWGVFLLSRDPIKSTGKVWVHVGLFRGKEVSFFSNTTNTQIAATSLAQKGYAVIGASVHLDWQMRDYSPQRDGYNARFTCPATIRAKLGEGSGDRERSLNLGLLAKGREAASTIDCATLANKASLGDGALAAKRALVARKRKPARKRIPSVAEMAAQMAKRAKR